MARVKKEYDAEGVKLTMRTRDYLADMSGQLALGIMANLVGQLQYFYTDKVGMAVGSVGVVMAIAKILDAFTDVIFGNIIDHSRGGNKKYFRWMIMLAVPAAAIVALMFTVPKGVASGVQVAYVLVTNILLSAVIYTMIATPFSAVMVGIDYYIESGFIGIIHYSLDSRKPGLVDIAAPVYVLCPGNGDPYGVKALFSY